MVKLAANLTMCFVEVPFLERFEAAAKSGFKGVEYLFPYPYPAEQLRGLLQDNGLEQVLFDLPSGNWERNERGIAALPGRVREFREGAQQAMEYAAALDCKLLTVLAGRVQQRHDLEAYEQTLLDNLKFAAAEARKVGATVLVEALNSKDVPDFLITSTAQAVEIVRELNEPNVRIQYDVYHMQKQEGDLAATIRKHIDLIAHFQIADNPGRNEPGTGEIDYNFLLDFIDKHGYSGWIGCEYQPKTSTVDGLGWSEQWLKT